MKIVKVLVWVLVALVGVFLIAAAFLPKSMNFSRSVVITKPPSAIYQVVADYHSWKKWSHWSKMDPTQKESISGPDKQVGSTMAWVGDKTGTGSMTIISAENGKTLKHQMVFLKPQSNTAWASFAFEPVAGGTKVTWDFQGNAPYPVGRWMCLIMAPMIGRAYEASLADLKTLLEENR